MKKSTKTALELIIVIVAIIFGSVISQGQTSDEVEEAYRKALQLNKERFDDPNLIYVGDTIFLPNRTGDGVEAWVAQEPTNGEHDSFWRLSEKYAAEEVETVPTDTTPPTEIKKRAKVVTEEDVGVVEKDSNASFPWMIIVVIILLVGIIYAAFVYYKKRKKTKESN